MKYQFSLRTMMVFTLSVSAAFGIGIQVGRNWGYWGQWVLMKPNHHEMAMLAAIEHVKKNEFMEAQNSIDEGRVHRFESKQKNDTKLIDRENEVGTMIETKRRELKALCDNGIKAFKGFVEKEDFDKAVKQLNELRPFDRHLPYTDQILMLQALLDEQRESQKKRLNAH